MGFQLFSRIQTVEIQHKHSIHGFLQSKHEVSVATNLSPFTTADRFVPALVRQAGSDPKKSLPRGAAAAAEGGRRTFKGSRPRPPLPPLHSDASFPTSHGWRGALLFLHRHRHHHQPNDGRPGERVAGRGRSKQGTVRQHLFPVHALPHR